MNVMKIDLIIFDLDGTLINSKLDIANSVNYMLEKLQLETLHNETIYTFVGNGVGNLVKSSLTEDHFDKFDDAMALFRQHYSEHLLDNTVLYDGITDILDHYKSKKKAVVTNKEGGFSRHILNYFSISDCFDEIVCGDAFPRKKPNPDQINAVIENLSVKRDNTLIIGDGDADIKAGKNANIHTCGVTYGFGSREILESMGADTIIDNISDMKNFFK